MKRTIATAPGEPAIEETLSPEEQDVLQAEWDANIVNKQTTEYVRNRETEYPPVGNQLDAVLKHVNYMRMQGQLDPATATLEDVIAHVNAYNNLVQDLDDVVAAWLAVKAKYPKPGP